MQVLTAEDRQRLLRQASAAYKTAHREQQEAGINVFIPTDSPHFETNEEVPLDPRYFITPVTDSNLQQTSTFLQAPRTHR